MTIPLWLLLVALLASAVGCVLWLVWPRRGDTDEFGDDARDARTVLKRRKNDQ